MSIDRLSPVDEVSASDSLALFSAAVGRDARATLTVIAEALQALLSASDDKVTQYAAPSATGFSVTISPAVTGGSVFLLLTPVAGYAAGTITLPASAINKQEVLVTSTQAVTTLTVSGNGLTVNGAPATLAANGFFRLRFDGVLKAWYRVG